MDPLSQSNIITSLDPFINKLRSEIMYLRDDLDDVKVKHVPSLGFFAKFEGEPEYKISAEAKIIERALASRKEISQIKYLK